MTLPVRPRSFAERPKTVVADVKVPANDNKTGALGAWAADGSFRFASSAAQEQWIRRAYQAGINADAWQQGDAVDDRTAELVSAGLGGPMPAIYQGPDGKYRSINPKTIETKDVRDHRNRYLAGKTMDQIAAAGRLPGEEAWLEQWKVTQARSAPVKPAAANDNQLAKQNTLSTADEKGKATAISPKFYGRAPAPMSPAERAAAKQNADDLGRIAMNSIAGDYGDEGRAALSAVGAWWNGKSFSDAYAEQLPKEKAESAAAEERQGLKGTAAEIATGFIPIVGDASGVVADFKDWKENGDDWDWTDYGAALIGALPFVPNRKLIKGGEKIGKALLGKSGDAAKKLEDEAQLLGSATASSDLPRDISDEIKRLLPNGEMEFYTKQQALYLPGEKRGLVYVLEAEPQLEHAAWYQGETPGTVWSVEHQKPANPALRYDNPDGDDLIKFDGVEPSEDGAYLVLIDSKTAMAPKPGMDKVKNTLERIGIALSQNNASSNVQFKVYYDFPTEKEAARARKIVRDLGHEDTITIRVRPATAKGQEQYKKLREPMSKNKKREQ